MLYGAGAFRRPALLISFFLIITSSFAQHPGDVNDHHGDTLRVLPKGDISVNIVSATSSLLQLELVYKNSDSITPVFVEFSANGFRFNANCILRQQINNINVEKNIEKIWGPEFVSLGIGSLPPQGRYLMNLALLNGIPGGSSIKVRVFGSVTGQNVLWSGTVKN